MGRVQFCGDFSCSLSGGPCILCHLIAQLRHVSKYVARKKSSKLNTTLLTHPLTHWPWLLEPKCLGLVPGKGGKPSRYRQELQQLFKLQCARPPSPGSSARTRIETSITFMRVSDRIGYRPTSAWTVGCCLRAALEVWGKRSRGVQ